MNTDRGSARRCEAQSILVAGLGLVMLGSAGPDVAAQGERPTLSREALPVSAAAATGGVPGMTPLLLRERDFAADPTLAAAAHDLVLLDLEPAPRGPPLRENLARYRLDAGTHAFCLDEDQAHLVRLSLEDERGKRILRLDRRARGRNHTPHARPPARPRCGQVTLPSGLYHLRLWHDSRRIGAAPRLAFLQPGSSAQPGLADAEGTPAGGFWALRPDPALDPLGHRRQGRVVAQPPDRSVPGFTAIRPLIADFASQQIDGTGLFSVATPSDPIVGSAQAAPLNLAPLDSSGFWTAFADDGPTGSQAFFQTHPLIVTDLGGHKVFLGVGREDGKLASLFLRQTNFSATTLMLNYDQPQPDPASPETLDVLFRFFPDGTQVGELQAGEVAIFQECNYQGKAAVFATDTPNLGALTSAVVTLDKTAASVKLGNDTGVFLNTGVAYSGARQLVEVNTPCLDGTPIGSATTSSLFIRSLFPTVIATTRKCEGCQLVGVDLSGADLSQVDLTGATLDGAKFVKAQLTQTIFNNASLDSADFSNATLFGAQLNNANLQGADLYAAFLANNTGGLISTSASLQNAHLKNVNLSFAQLSGVNFSFANFYSDSAAGVGTCATAAGNYQGFTQGCASAHGADLTDTTFDDAYLFGVDFTDAKVAGTSFLQATLPGANFAAATLSGFSQSGKATTCRRAHLQGVNLATAVFSGAAAGSYDLSDAFVDFTLGGNNIFILLNGQNHNNFVCSPASPCAPPSLQDVCVEVNYPSPTTVPAVTSGFTCPNGATSGCGPATPDGSNVRWASRLDIGNPPPGVPPGWYDQNATYTKAPANTGLVCGGKGDQAAVILW